LRIRPLLLLIATLALAGCGLSSGEQSSSSGTGAGAQPTEPSLRPPLSRSYAALGASETYGVGAIPHTSGYAYLVARALHAHPYINTGIPGTTVDAGYQSELTDALGRRPRLATVFFGVNDLRAGVDRASFLGDLHDLVATLRQARTQVIIVGVPDVSLLPAVRRQHISGVNTTVASWNRGMRAIARQTGAHYLDLTAFTHTLATHSNYIAPDGLHPSTIGHRRLARIVLNAIHQWHLWSTS
jgi:lysophospholipase L1-like esterase